MRCGARGVVCVVIVYNFMFTETQGKQATSNEQKEGIKWGAGLRSSYVDGGLLRYDKAVY